MAALGAAVEHPELDARRFFADRFAREREIFERAVRRGELKESVDPMLVVDLLAGAVWVRSVFRGCPCLTGSRGTRSRRCWTGSAEGRVRRERAVRQVSGSPRGRPGCGRAPGAA
ncbi:TetR-like C-terminal domain-containing protein [Nonomuraea ferruginea]